jgi:hypothetical protein
MAVRRKTANLPTSDEVWERVASFATECVKKKRPVYTVTRKVKNEITDVKEKSIGRISERGISNVSRVTKAMVEYLWAEILGEGTGGQYLYFTKPLLLAAIPEVVEDMDGEIVLRSDPQVIETKARRKTLAATDGRGWGGGEGEMHKAIKEFVFSDPDVALASLRTGPYQRVAMEYVFPTGDRVDVVLLDGSGNVLLVEVKPFVDGDDLSPFAQAAKYRVLWSILRDRPVEEIRCLVAAPGITGPACKRMFDSHRIESVDIKIPTTAQRPSNKALNATGARGRSPAR